MTQWEIKDVYEKNKKYCIIVAVIVLLLVAGYWLYRDSHRNDTINHNTDATVEQLEKRIDAVESGLDRVQKRNDEAKKTVESVGRGISTSTGLAIEIEEGTGRAEDRLNSAISRTERIKGIIADIEKANR
jgi:predicted negative regulator of RcsB-dependent stress response